MDALTFEILVHDGGVVDHFGDHLHVRCIMEWHSRVVAFKSGISPEMIDQFTHVTAPNGTCRLCKLPLAKRYTDAKPKTVRQKHVRKHKPDLVPAVKHPWVGFDFTKLEAHVMQSITSGKISHVIHVGDPDARRHSDADRQTDDAGTPPDPGDR